MTDHVSISLLARQQVMAHRELQGRFQLAEQQVRTSSKAAFFSLIGLIHQYPTLCDESTLQISHVLVVHVSRVLSDTLLFRLDWSSLRSECSLRCSWAPAA